MKFFLDTADIDEIRDLAATGLIDGVTTNPSLVAKAGGEFFDTLQKICKIIPGPVSAEVTATIFQDMVLEGKELIKIAGNIVVKLPITMDGLKACRALTEEGASVNMTLCFSVPQALLAAKAGATYVSPFVGRLDDISVDGMTLISDICKVFTNYRDLETQVLVASIRGPLHLIEAAKIGAHVATIPPKVLKQLVNHPLTDQGLSTFLADWGKTGQSILKPLNHGRS